MKLSKLATTVLLFAVAGSASAQSTTRPQEPVEATMDEGKVNPMTGKLLSEERLTRQLGSEKLATSIIQEQVKQAELKNQLGLASSRKAVEEARLRSESANLSTPGRRGADIPLRESLTNREKSLAPKGGTVAQTAPAPFVQMPPSAPPAPVATGSIKIGEDTFNVNARYTGPDARVTYVDAQPRPAQAALAAPQAAAPVAAAPAGNFVPAITGPAGGTPIRLLPNYSR